FLSKHLEHPEQPPSYWYDAAAALQREGDATRVLEIPGSNFAAYRWGNLVDTPVTPSLIDRPFVAREVLPFGSPPSVNLLDALDLTVPAQAPDPPPAALFDVTKPVPIVHTAPSTRPVVLAGDGEGIVDAAAAGLLDGNQLVLELPALKRSQLQQALDAHAD